MTNHWIDIGNSDVILVMGANPAENHPISMKWINRAMERGARLISVDPRFTRTSAKADLHAALRPGTDIAFLGGMIAYILDHRKYFQEYVARYTNAGFLVQDTFSFQDGLFSGYDQEERRYDRSSWAFEVDESGRPKQDLTLEDPRCVLKLLKKHFQRYDLESVSATTGVPKDILEQVYETFSASGEKQRAGTIMYAMGWTQHTVGVQNIRAMAIVQLLLGNIGLPGGGINALRGESNVQGSTDHGLLWNVWPGYLKTPAASQAGLNAYHQARTPVAKDPLSANWWGNYPKYSVSFLKSMFGDAGTEDNEFGYSWMPKVDDDQAFSWLNLFDQMLQGNIQGFFAWGQNPACSGANAGKNRQALAQLDWMVNVNLFDNETGSFWMGPGMDPRKIKTEVFFLPCASSLEKEGSITNSGRWSQWRYQAQEPPDQARPDGEIIIRLMDRIRDLYREEGGALPDPVLKLKWDYVKDGRFDAHKVAKEINGYFQKTVVIKGRTYQRGELVPSFALLQDDGSTSSGNWLYCNSYTDQGNMAARRDKDDPTGLGLNPGWAWCWPVNRRVLYNRASVDLQGRPWNPKRPLLRFAGEVKQGKFTTQKWIGDVPDGGWYPMQNPDGSARDDSRYPFIMKPSGRAHVFGPGLKDGPFPEHYEPLECPVKKNLFSSRMLNPAVKLFPAKADPWFSCDPRFPLVGTTYRLTEHWQTGIMTRWQPWLLEAAPGLFVEMSLELASSLEVQNGERVKVSSARGEVEAVALVTARIKPLKVHDSVVHFVGLPWCFGWRWPEDGGDSANLLTPAVGDPNTQIPETKAFMVNVTRI